MRILHTTPVLIARVPTAVSSLYVSYMKVSKQSSLVAEIKNSLFVFILHEKENKRTQ